MRSVRLTIACLALCAAAPCVMGADAGDPPPPSAPSAPAPVQRSGATSGDTTDQVAEKLEEEDTAKDLGMYERLRVLADKITQQKFPAIAVHRAVPYVILSLFLILLGYNVYKVSVILFVGSAFCQIGAFMAPEESVLMYSLIGSAVGGVIAIPLEKLVFTFIGAMAGVVVGVLISNLIRTDIQGMFTAGTIGLLVGGGISFLYEKAVLIVGFSLWGAVLGTYGTMCLYLGKEAGEELLVPPIVLIAMLIASGVGISFQVLLDSKYGTDQSGDGVPD
jgi:hypothetical protein